MPLIRDTPAPQTDIEVLLDRIKRLERKVARLAQAQATTMQRTDTTDHPDPVYGETVLHSPTLTDDERDDESNGYQRRMYEHRWFLDGKWHNPGKFLIKVDDDETVIETGSRLIWAVPIDLDGAQLYFAEAFVTTVGGAITVDLYNKTQTQSLLLDLLHIDAGELHSADATLSVGIAGNNPVAHKDQIDIRVPSGSGALGFGVLLGFS